MNNNSTSKTNENEYLNITQVDFDRSIFHQGLEPVIKKQHISLLDIGRKTSLVEFLASAPSFDGLDFNRDKSPVRKIDL